MNKLTIIGNLTKDPELRTTATGLSVCSFSVAVNRRTNQDNGAQETDFFRITAWRQLGELCARWLTKGRKVCVVGPVSVSTYTGQDGKTYANLEVTAQDVEFLSSMSDEQRQEQRQNAQAKPAGFTAVETDDLPF